MTEDAKKKSSSISYYGRYSRFIESSTKIRDAYAVAEETPVNHRLTDFIRSRGC
jgi:hypothetical protein